MWHARPRRYGRNGSAMTAQCASGAAYAGPTPTDPGSSALYMHDGRHDYAARERTRERPTSIWSALVQVSEGMDLTSALLIVLTVVILAGVGVALLIMWEN